MDRIVSLVNVIFQGVLEFLKEISVLSGVRDAEKQEENNAVWTYPYTVAV